MDDSVQWCHVEWVGIRWQCSRSASIRPQYGACIPASYCHYVVAGSQQYPEGTVWRRKGPTLYTGSPTHRTQSTCALPCHFLVVDESAKAEERRSVVPMINSRRVQSDTEQERYACLGSTPSMHGHGIATSHARPNAGTAKTQNARAKARY